MVKTWIVIYLGLLYCKGAMVALAIIPPLLGKQPLPINLDPVKATLFAVNSFLL